MSTNISNCVWQVPLKSYQKLVLLALADYADEKGLCYPSLTELSKKCGISQSTVLTHLKCLIRKGVVYKKRRCDDLHHQKTNMYRLNLSLLSKAFFQAFFEIDCKSKNNHPTVIIGIKTAKKEGKNKRKIETLRSFTERQ